MEMTWQEKFKALRALNRWDTTLNQRDDFSWYVHMGGVERKEGGCLSSGCDNGKTPEEAVNQRWKWVTDPRYYIVTEAGGSKRHAVKWNGFMWETVEED